MHKHTFACVRSILGSFHLKEGGKRTEGGQACRVPTRIVIGHPGHWRSVLLLGSEKVSLGHRHRTKSDKVGIYYASTSPTLNNAMLRLDACASSG